MSLNIVMKENDIIGCGYKRGEDQSDKGMVYFTYNGSRLAEGLDGVQCGLYPVIHIQKKVTTLINPQFKQLRSSPPKYGGFEPVASEFALQCSTS